MTMEFDTSKWVDENFEQLGKGIKSLRTKGFPWYVPTRILVQIVQEVGKRKQINQLVGLRLKFKEKLLLVYNSLKNEKSGLTVPEIVKKTYLSERDVVRCLKRLKEIKETEQNHYFVGSVREIAKGVYITYYEVSPRRIKYFQCPSCKRLTTSKIEDNIPEDSWEVPYHCDCDYIEKNNRFIKMKQISGSVYKYQNGKKNIKKV